jgi:hypothetical protein
MLPRWRQEILLELAGENTTEQATNRGPASGITYPDCSGNLGSETYEVLSVRDQHGDELGAGSVFLLDEIEGAVEDDRMIQRYEAKMLDNEIAHLSHLYF